MKLFARYTRRNLLALLAVFGIGIVGLFLLLRAVLVRQVDEGLDAERDETLQYIRRYDRLPPPVSVSDRQVSYRAVAAPEHPAYTTLRVRTEEGLETMRRLRFPVWHNGQWYQFYVRVPLEQVDELLGLLALPTVGLLALLLLLLYLVNRRVTRQLLRPFYHTIDAVSRYSLAQQTPLALPETPVEEFTALNQALNGLTARAQQDFEAMRSFTAQAAHEMQTPLAVLRARVEALAQQLPQLGAAGAQQLAAIEQSVERLTRLFGSLLLLTKIENRQYAIEDQVQMEALVAAKADNLQDLMTAKNIDLQLALHPCSVFCNQHLAEVLVGNLLQNAVRYNQPGGTIRVSLTPDALCMANNSYLPEMNAEDLCRPFYRHENTQASGSGLGLAIVRQICDYSGWRFRYGFKDGLHQFQVFFDRA